MRWWLYQVFLQAYTYSTADVRTKFIENKRYTMRDIGRFEERIKNVEYYTTLNLLEKSAADMAIKDQNGLDRFKNGFIADKLPTSKPPTCRIEFKAAMDRTRRELRPSFKAKNFALNPVCRPVPERAMAKQGLRSCHSFLNFLRKPIRDEAHFGEPVFPVQREGPNGLIAQHGCVVWTKPALRRCYKHRYRWIRSAKSRTPPVCWAWTGVRGLTKNTTIIGTTLSQSVQSYHNPSFRDWKFQLLGKRRRKWFRLPA